MQARRSSTVVLVYVGTVATALATIAFGLSTIVTASVGVSQAGATDRTLLQAQVESSREIRRALATPIAIPPLPPITAHLAREVASVSARKRPDRAALAASPERHGDGADRAHRLRAEPEASPQPRYQARDRMAIGGW